MPYRTTWEAQGILWEFFGRVTAQEIQEANEAFYNDGRSDRAKYQIIDAARVTEVEWEEKKITLTAAYDIGATRTIRTMKVAYVAENEEVVDRLEKYIEISRRLNSNWSFKGFRDLDSARAWAKPAPVRSA